MKLFQVDKIASTRLLSEYTGLNLYREFKSLPLRQILIQLNPGQAEKCFLARDLQKRFVRVRLKKAIDNPPFGGYFWGYETPCQE